MFFFFARFSLFQLVLQDATEAFFSRLNGKITKRHLCVLTRFGAPGGLRDTFISQTVSLSTSSRSHSKQKKKSLPDFPCVFLSSDNHPCVPWMWLNGGPDVCHMQICTSRRVGNMPKWLTGERKFTYRGVGWGWVGGDTSFLARWFLKNG